MKLTAKRLLIPEILVAVLMFFGLAGAQAQTADTGIDSALAALPDVKVIAKAKHADRWEYQLTSVKQPVDHTNSGYRIIFYHARCTLFTVGLISLW